MQMTTLESDNKFHLAGEIVSRRLVVQYSIYINDWRNVRRTWRERLFSRPWKPRERMKRVFRPRAYVLEDKTVIVSPETYDAVIKAGYENKAGIAQ